MDGTATTAGVTVLGTASPWEMMEPKPINWRRYLVIQLAKVAVFMALATAYVYGSPGMTLRMVEGTTETEAALGCPAGMFEVQTLVGTDTYMAECLTVEEYQARRSTAYGENLGHLLDLADR